METETTEEELTHLQEFLKQYKGAKGDTHICLWVSDFE